MNFHIFMAVKNFRWHYCGKERCALSRIPITLNMWATALAWRCRVHYLFKNTQVLRHSPLNRIPNAISGFQILWHRQIVKFEELYKFHFFNYTNLYYCVLSVSWYEKNNKTYFFGVKRIPNYILHPADYTIQGKKKGITDCN